MSELVRRFASGNFHSFLRDLKVIHYQANIDPCVPAPVCNPWLRKFFENHDSF
jgi:hypothetical protein